MVPLRVCLGYFHPWTNDVGLLIAQRERWYAAAGIDLTLVLHDPFRGDTMTTLADGSADVVVCPSSRLLVRRDRGEPVVGIAAVNHGALDTVQTVRGTGVRRPRDLAGKVVAYNPTPRGRAMVRHLVAADGGDPDAVVTFDSGFRELSADTIAEGGIDATFGGYWTWDALFTRVPREEHVVWPVDTIGAPSYHSYVLAARTRLTDQDPDLLRTFLAVTERGYREAVADPGLALACLERVVPYFPPSTVATSLDLCAQTWFDDGEWGRHRDALFEPYSRWLHQNGLLVTPDWSGAVTNTLLPRAEGEHRRAA